MATANSVQPGGGVNIPMVPVRQSTSHKVETPPTTKEDIGESAQKLDTLLRAMGKGKGETPEDIREAEQVVQDGAGGDNNLLKQFKDLLAKLNEKTGGGGSGKTTPAGEGGGGKTPCSGGGCGGGGGSTSSTDPKKSAPAVAESAKTESAKTESAKTESAPAPAAAESAPVQA